MAVKWIIESGGTKSQWAVIEGKNVLLKEDLTGYNPYVHGDHVLSHHIRTILDKARHQPDHIVMYSSGARAEKLALLHSIWQRHFPGARINVHSDIVAVAHACARESSGWIGILGTGSTWAYYDGKEVVKSISGLGWRIGDEGGARDISKSVLKAYCRQILKPDTMQAVSLVLGKTSEEIISKIQDEDQLFALLSHLSRHLPKLLEHVELRKMAEKRIKAFIDLIKLDKSYGLHVYLSGSVAFAFRKEIEEMLNSSGFELKKVVQYPIDTLIDKYVQND